MLTTGYGPAGPSRVIDLAKESAFDLGAIHVRPSAREVLLPKRRELLEPRVMQVLTALAQADGEVVSREELIERCWAGRLVSEDSINRCIVRLRKLGEAAGGAFVIETVPKIGYRLQVAAGWVADAPARLRPWSQVRAGWGAAALGLIIAAACLGAWLVARPEPNLRTAVLPFAVRGSGAEARAVQAGLQDAIISALTQQQVPTAGRDAAPRPGHGRARVLVGGDVEVIGQALRLRVRIDDARSGAMLWSAVLERPATQATALPDQAGAMVADVLHLAQRDFGHDLRKADPLVLADYLKVVQLTRLGPGRATELLQVERDLTRRAPWFSRGHSGLACDLGSSLQSQPPQIAARWRAEALAEVRRAQALDAYNGDAYLALALIEPQRAWAVREAHLLRGLARDPQNADLLTILASLDRSAGFGKAALPLQQQALMLDPLSPPKTSTNVYALIGTGRLTDAESLIRRGLKLWPDYAGLRRGALYARLLYGSPDEALAALRVYQTGDPILDPVAEQAWRSYVEDRRQGRRSRRTAELLVAAAKPTWSDSSEIVSALAQLGDVDAALKLANDLAVADPVYYNQPALFEPASAPMRRDARFMAVMSRLGLTDYWRSKDRWPDFCAEPGLRYDCKSEAIRVSPGTRS